MLCDQSAHQQSTVASPQDRKLLRPRVLLLDQIFSGGREIIEHVLFFREIPGPVPFLTELAAAADIRHHKNAATIEPKPAGEIKTRRHADAVTAVAVKQRGIVAVALRSLLADDV